jgi:4-hydroxy-3-methylbut-2-en-1-yl diphosphate reductase
MSKEVPLEKSSLESQPLLEPFSGISANQALFPFSSPSFSELKIQRKELDGRKKNFTPFSLVDGNLEVALARHFGFCFGVERAVEIAYRAVAENKDRRVFLLSEMIHNPDVNNDLRSKGVQFLLDTSGKEVLFLSSLTPDDVVILPAFGVSLEMESRLTNLGIKPELYDTTCPFVERVWKKSRQIAEKGYTIIVHGKPAHEETRATFSRAAAYGPVLIIRSIAEALLLSEFILGKKDSLTFFDHFPDRTSENFDPVLHLMRCGVVNQTTMLAEETSEISRIVKEALLERSRKSLDAKSPQTEASAADTLNDVFADTRDTLCYATSENQNSVHSLMNVAADFAVVVGGFNSSNTTHLATICSRKFVTYHISQAADLISLNQIRFRDVASGVVKTTTNWLLAKDPPKVKVVVTAGASTPDAIVEEVLRLLGHYVNSTL